MTSDSLKNNITCKLFAYRSYLWYIDRNRIWHWIARKRWYAIKLNQLKSNQSKCLKSNSRVLKWIFYIIYSVLDKSCILPFLKKGDLRITKNYKGITLTSIATKIYNALLLNRFQSEIKKVPKKNQNSFQRDWPTTSQILTIRRIIRGISVKNLGATLLISLRYFILYKGGRWSK